MKYHLRHLLIGLTLVFVPFLAVAPAAAVDVFQPCNTTGVGNAPSANSSDVCHAAQAQAASGSNPFIDAVKLVINIISYVVGFASVIFVIVGALRMILAGGDSKSFAEGRSSVLYAVVGIVVVIIAQSLVVFVLDKVT